MSLYLLSLAVTLAINAWLTWRSCIRGPPRQPLDGGKQDPLELADHGHESDSDWSSATVEDWTIISRQYLTVYGFVVGADWLQGSFIYALYKHQYELSETLVAALFAAGFASAAVSAPVVGYIADRFGRKKACLAYCGLYSVSCMLTMVNNNYALFISRVLGGMSATLLYSVFEAWLVSEAKSQDNSDDLVQRTVGSAAKLNAAVAILSGAVSELLVAITADKRMPFAAAIVCLMCAGAIISAHWDENFGGESEVLRVRSHDCKISFHSFLPTTSMTILTCVTCAMEGSMYAMVFFWTRSIQMVRPALSGEAPYGLIFANFMSAMMLGSRLCSYLTNVDGSVAWTSRLLATSLPIAAGCLMFTVLSVLEYVRFFAFCAFEMTLGVYFPVIALLKSQTISDSTRAWTYAAMRMPLNVFVMSILCTTGEDDTYRQRRFILCGAMLLVAVVGLQKLGRAR